MPATSNGLVGMLSHRVTLAPVDNRIDVSHPSDFTYYSEHGLSNEFLLPVHDRLAYYEGDIIRNRSL